MAEVRRGLGYNGELLEPLTRALHLGGGLRVYSPVAIRFHSPDRLSPFGAGGSTPTPTAMVTRSTVWILPAGLQSGWAVAWRRW